MAEYKINPFIEEAEKEYAYLKEDYPGSVLATARDQDHAVIFAASSIIKELSLYEKALLLILLPRLSNQRILRIYPQDVVNELGGTLVDAQAGLKVMEDKQFIRYIDNGIYWSNPLLIENTKLPSRIVIDEKIKRNQV